MRLAEDKRQFLKNGLKKLSPGADVYLFGSRAFDDQYGGDIDILWLTDEKYQEYEKLRKFKIEFYKKFGIQKLDIVNFGKEEDAIFKKIAMESAVIL